MEEIKTWEANLSEEEKKQQEINEANVSKSEL